MNCRFHTDKEANHRCFDCGILICEKCANAVDGKILCENCKEKVLNNDFKYEGKKHNHSFNNYSSFWSFIFSFIPGAGHMYHGLMVRGLQLMIAFISVIVISTLMYTTSILGVFSVVIWFYSFFDIINIKRAINKGEEVKDISIYNVDLSNVNYYYIGIGLIIFGVIFLINETSYRFIRIHYLNNIIYIVLNIIKSSILPALMILGGIILLKKYKKVENQ